MSTTIHLKTVGLGMAHDGDLLFSGLDLVLREGDRIGVVGPNGAGKTTLLRALAGEIAPTAGTVSLAPGARRSHVRQAMSLHDVSVAAFLSGGLGELAAVTARLRAPEAVGATNILLVDPNASVANLQAFAREVMPEFVPGLEAAAE